MFTRGDYKEYFSSILEKERDMIFSVADIRSSISDEEALKILEIIINDEIKHYSYVAGLFENLLLQGKVEKRKFRRQHSLGDAWVRDLKTKEEIKARCVNVSEGGICIESDKPLEVGNLFEVAIEFYDGSEPVRRVGKLVWYKEVIAKLNIGGIEFKLN